MPNLMHKLQNSVNAVPDRLARPAFYLCGLILVLGTIDQVTAFGMPGMGAEDSQTSSWLPLKISKRWLIWLILGEDHQPNATWSECLLSQSKTDWCLTIALAIGLLALGYGSGRIGKMSGSSETSGSVPQPNWRVRISQKASWPINYLWSKLWNGRRAVPSKPRPPPKERVPPKPLGRRRARSQKSN